MEWEQLMMNLVDGSIDKLTSSRKALLQCFYQVLLSRTYDSEDKVKHHFSSDRLLIRPLQFQDKTFYIGLFTNKKVTKYTGGLFTNQQTRRNFINSLKALSVIPIQYLTWVVKSKDSGDYIGIITLIWHENKKQLAEFGIMFTPHKHNQGYCCELTESLINHCFKILQLSTLYSFTLNKNLTAQHILKKFKFTETKKVPFSQPAMNGFYWKRTNKTL